MAYNGTAYTLTTSPVLLTTALALSARKTIRQADFIVLTGSETGYLGPSSVDNAGANARAKFTTSTGFSFVPNPDPNTALPTDDIYIVGTATAVALITLVD